MTIKLTLTAIRSGRITATYTHHFIETTYLDITDYSNILRDVANAWVRENFSTNIMVTFGDELLPNDLITYMLGVKDIKRLSTIVRTMVMTYIGYNNGAPY